MIEANKNKAAPLQSSESNTVWMRETAFGRWFLRSKIWSKYVLDVAIADFQQMTCKRLKQNATILDIGCGVGLAFNKLEQAFQPAKIIGIDIDNSLIVNATVAASQCACETIVQLGAAQQLRLPDASIDVVFCHQLIHHVSDQKRVLTELYRVLKPGGKILLAESCKPFIHSMGVKLLFRHPDSHQHTAEEYIEMFRQAGFAFENNDIKTSAPWWSRRYFGLLDLPKSIIGRPPNITEILVVAEKQQPSDRCQLNTEKVLLSSPTATYAAR